MNLPPVSVYVPCYNSTRTLYPALLALCAQTHRPHEILIIDDGSNDDTIPKAHQILKHFDIKAKFITKSGHGGLAHSRNIAFELAECELVAAFDSDAVPSPDWLETGCRILQQCDDIHLLGGWLQEIGATGYGNVMRRRLIEYRSGDNPPLHPCRFASGSNHLMRKSSFLATGGFDLRNLTNGEDVYIAEQLQKIFGECVYFSQDMTVQHLQLDSLFSAIYRYWRYVHHSNWHDISLYRTYRGMKANFKYAYRLYCQGKADGLHGWTIIDLVIFPFLLLYFDLRAFINRHKRNQFLHQLRQTGIDFQIEHISNGKG